MGLTTDTTASSFTDLVLQVDATIPTGKQKMYAKFNAYSGVFLTCMSIVDITYLNTDNFVYIEVEIDPITQVVVGTKDNFQIVDKATAKTKIYETQVNELCKTKIYKRFQLEVQLDILRNVIAEIAEKVGVENESLIDMNDYIDNVKRANKVLKQSYIDNPDFEFITIDQEAAEQEAMLDGGLHEQYGPANIVGLGLNLDR